MKTSKTITEKTIAPKRGKNRNSTVAKTGADNGRGAMNGMFTTELQISDADRPEFEEMRASLSQKYAPITLLRQILLDLILSCAWRLKLELRKESRKAENSHTERKGEAAGGDTILMERWYATDYRSLQDGLRFLKDLRADVANCGLLHLEQDGPWKQSVIKGFGQPFYDRLTQWKFMSTNTIQMAEHLVAMEEAYSKGEYPFVQKSPAVRPSSGEPELPVEDQGKFRMKPPPMEPRRKIYEDSELPKVVPDPRLQWQMVLKLIDAEIEHLEMLVRTRGQSFTETPRALAEPSPRSLADASRDLQWPIELFLKLEKKGL
jgi:hypothetical protein